MGRPPSKEGAALKVLQQIAAAQGGELDMAAFERLRKGHNFQVPEAESVLKSLHKPHAFMTKKCKRKSCGAEFQTNYCGISYCSDECIAADMRALGLEYDPYRMKRWESSMYNSEQGLIFRYEPPEVISTQTLLELERYALNLLADLDRLRGIAEPEERQQRREVLEEKATDWGFLERKKAADRAAAESRLVPESLDTRQALEDSVVPTNLPSEHQEPKPVQRFF